MAIDAINTSNLKTIIFDWDGTIFNNVSAIHAATETALEKYNIDYPTDQAVAEFIKLMEKMETNALPKILLQSYQLLNEISFVKHLSYVQKLQVVLYLYSVYSDYSKESTLFSGAEEVIQGLAKKYNLALLTNSKRALIHDLLKKFNLNQYFNTVLSLDDVTNPKPHPEGLQKLLTQLEQKPEEVVYIGDLVADLRAAKSARVNSIVISSGLASRESLVREKPSVILDHITDLTEVFDLPEITIDKEKDLAFPFKHKEEKIKDIVSKEFSVFNLIEQSIPQRLDIHHIQRIAQNPIGFIGAIFQDMIEYYGGGELKLQEEFEFFTGFEDDLLKSLGLIIIHFINERSDNVFEKLYTSKYPPLNTINALGYTIFDFSMRNLYPTERKREIQQSFVQIFKDVIPERVVEVLLQMDPDHFAGYILDGCAIAMTDLGLRTRLNLNDNRLLRTPLKPLNYLIGFVNTAISKVESGVKEVVMDVLEHDFNHLPIKN